MNHAAKRKLARKLLSREERKQVVTKHAKYSVGLFSSLGWGARHGQIAKRVARVQASKAEKAQRIRRFSRALKLGIAQTDL